MSRNISIIEVLQVQAIVEGEGFQQEAHDSLRWQWCAHFGAKSSNFRVEGFWGLDVQGLRKGRTSSWRQIRSSHLLLDGCMALVREKVAQVSIVET